MSGNVALTQIGGNLAIVQCVEPEFTIRSISASSVLRVEGANVSRTIYVGNAADGGRVIAEGEALPLVAPIERLITAKAGDPSISTLSNGSTIYVSISGDDGRVDEAFEDVQVSDLEEGRYLYRNGESGHDACADGK